MKYILLLLILLFSLSCSQHKLTNQAFVFENTSQFMRQLQQLEKTMDTDNYIELTDAIGYLKAHDIKNISISEFYMSLRGLTPHEIIVKAKR